MLANIKYRMNFCLLFVVEQRRAYDLAFKLQTPNGLQSLQAEADLIAKGCSTSHCAASTGDRPTGARPPRRPELGCRRLGKGEGAVMRNLQPPFVGKTLTDLTCTALFPQKRLQIF